MGSTRGPSAAARRSSHSARRLSRPAASSLLRCRTRRMPPHTTSVTSDDVDGCRGTTRVPGIAAAGPHGVSRAAPISSSETESTARLGPGSVGCAAVEPVEGLDDRHGVGAAAVAGPDGVDESADQRRVRAGECGCGSRSRPSIPPPPCPGQPDGRLLVIEREQRSRRGPSWPTACGVWLPQSLLLRGRGGSSVHRDDDFAVGFALFDERQGFEGSVEREGSVQDRLKDAGVVEGGKVT